MAEGRGLAGAYAPCMSRRMSTTRIQEGDRCTLQITGQIDGKASRELAAQLAAETARELTVDFFSAASIDDRCLAELADALRSRAHVTVRGLRDHQLRVLACFGVEGARALTRH